MLTPRSVTGGQFIVVLMPKLDACPKTPAPQVVTVKLPAPNAAGGSATIVIAMATRDMAAAVSPRRPNFIPTSNYLVLFPDAHLF